MFTLALVQMRVDGGAKEDNLVRAEAFIAQAASGGADVVLLPEALNLGWTHSSARTDADEMPNGGTCSRMRAAARRHGVHVCLGLIERAEAAGYETLVLTVDVPVVGKRRRDVRNGFTIPLTLTPSRAGSATVTASVT